MPSLLTPDFGLLFWMCISFIIVFVILKKSGFPIITQKVEERKAFIDQSLQNARIANLKLTNIKSEGETIIKEARVQQSEIIKEANSIRDHIVKEAQQKALEESRKILTDAQEQIKREKELALQDIRSQVLSLSVEIAEKILKKNLCEESKQKDFLKGLLDDYSTKFIN